MTFLLEHEQGDAAFAKLMAAPLSAPRKRIRKGAAPAVAPSQSSAGLPLWAIVPRSAPSILTKPIPRYRAWLGRVLSPADADYEAARSAAEWAIVRTAPHPFIRAVYLGDWPASPRARHAIDVWIGARVAAVMAGRPIVERKAAARRSRCTWPSFRKQQRAALIAAGELDYLDSLGIFYVARADLARVRFEEEATA